LARISTEGRDTTKISAPIKFGGLQSIPVEGRKLITGKKKPGSAKTRKKEVTKGKRKGAQTSIDLGLGENGKRGGRGKHTSAREGALGKERKKKQSGEAPSWREKVGERE